MPDQLKNLLIGFFVIAACTIVIFILLFLHPTVGDDKEVFFVRFANIDKISVGTRVTFAGKPVGEVADIQELSQIDYERKEYHGHVYVYELELRIDSSVQLYKSDEISAKTSGLLGEKSVAITPKPPLPGQKLEPLTAKDIIYADESGSMEETLKDIQELANRMGHAIDEIVLTAKQVGNKNLWNDISATAKNLHEISEAFNKKAAIEQTIANVEKLSSKAMESWQTVDTSLENIQLMTQSGLSSLKKIENGEGSLGKIIGEDDLYLRAKSLFSKADILMNDINHYGLLFQSDKGWQRLRARRLNLLNKLSTPQEFYNFFNDEIDQVNTSLSRVALLLDKMNQDGSYCCFIEDPAFAKVYADLLRRVSDMEEALEMYNQQAVDACNER